VSELSPGDVLGLYPAHVDTIPTLLASRAARLADKVALEFERHSWTYAQLDESSTVLARLLVERGVAKGDRLALVSVNTDVSVVLFLAATKAGAIFTPLNPAATNEDLEYMLRHSRASLVVAQQEDLERTRTIVAQIDASTDVLALNDLGVGEPDSAAIQRRIGHLARDAREVPLPAILADDPAIVIYTSGTTGFPKGVVHSQRNYVLAGEAFVARLHLQPSDRLLTLLPFFHINALFYSLGGAIAAGGTIITARNFSASRFWNLAAETRATQFNFLAAVGTILIKRARSEFNPAHTIRKMYGGPMTEEMLRVFRDEFHVPWMVEGYGMSEIPGASCNPFLGPHVFGSIGVPAVHPRFPGSFSALRIEDDSGKELPPGEIGELVVKTPIVFKRYLDDPEQTAAAFRNGWFLTGDLARRDENGYFYFVARKKDIIRRRGENISGAELDRVVSSHPDVQEAAAIGVPSELGEDDILVVVVLKPGVKMEHADVIEFCRSKLAPMKVPRFVVFAETLPHTPSHRVAKHRIKADTALIARARDMERSKTASG
jgi:crotonobetaine/carnitine-CoA ligase